MQRYQLTFRDMQMMNVCLQFSERGNEASMTRQKHPVITVIPFNHFLPFSFFLVMIEIAMLHSEKAHKLVSTRSTSAQKAWCFMNTMIPQLMSAPSHASVKRYNCWTQDKPPRYLCLRQRLQLILCPQSAVHNPCNMNICLLVRHSKIIYLKTIFF